MAETTLSAQITNLVGGTIDQDACDTWAAEACKEIINVLPARLKEKCMTATGVGTDSVVDLDGLGEILYVTRKNADAGYYTECRKIPSSRGGLATDSTDLNYYGTASDPVYWVDGDTSGAATLYVKPTPTANQPAILHHIGYPTVDVSASTVEIANFPDEATYLVVLFAASRQLLKFQATMSASFNSDITTALTAVNTELDETQAICDKIDADLVLAKAEIVLAKAEAAELATYTDNSSEFETACDAMKTELDKVDNIIVEASAEFDKVDNVIVEGSTEFDEAKNLSGAYNSGAMSTALAAIKTELDKADNNILIAYNKTVDYYTEIAFLENGDLWDNTNKRFDEVKDALDKAQSLLTDDATYNALSTVTDDVTNVSALYQLGQEDTELFSATLSLVQAELGRAGATASEIGLLIQKHSLPLGGVSQLMSTASGYISQAQGYVSQVNANIAVMNAFIGTGNAYLQEAGAIVGQGNAYLSEANAYISQAGGYASEVGARSTFASAKSQAIQGHISIAQNYIASATGFGNEVQSKIAIGNGYIAEATARLQMDSSKYQWYGDQHAKLSAEYARGLAVLKGG